MYEPERRRKRGTGRRRRRHWGAAAAVGALFFLALLVAGVVWQIRETAAAARGNAEAVSMQQVLEATQPEGMKMVSREDPTQAEDGIWCVVIDAGHGGDESPGAVFGGIYEREVNLAIARLVQEILEKEGCHVIMTQTGNTYVGLEERAETANRAGADVFVSIHQNSVENDSSAAGIETWYHKGKQDGSSRLAELVQSCTAEASGARDRGTRTASDLVVIRETEMASCLIETGFLSNKAERAKLTDTAYQKTLAQGIAEGILAYLQEFH